jgi:hypothetical protein
MYGWPEGKQPTRDSAVAQKWLSRAAAAGDRFAVDALRRLEPVGGHQYSALAD